MAFTAKTRLQLILETLRELDDFGTEDILNGNITNVATTFVCTDTAFSQYKKNAILEMEQELMRVSADATSTSVTVVRGIRGTTAATHADLTMVRINPKYTQDIIIRHINACLESEVEQLKVDDDTTTTASNTVKYDLPTGVTRQTLKSVFFRSSKTDSSAYKNAKPELRWNINDGQGTAGVDQIEFKFFPQSALYVHYYYRGGFTILETDAASCDLPLFESAQRLPVYYAASMLLPRRDVKRLRRDRNTYPDGGTPMTARPNMGEWYETQFRRIRRQHRLQPTHGFPLTVV